MTNLIKDIIKIFDGGPGSGNYGHEGRPGKVGGSGEGKTSMEYLDSEVLVKPEEHSLGKHIYVKNGKKRITPDRKKLHTQIENDFIKGVKPSKNPTVYFNAGGSAAGKGSISNFVKDYPTLENKTGIVVDPDEIKRKLPEFDDSNPNSAPFTHEESSMLSKHLLRKAINSKKYDVLMDGTLAGSVNSVRRKIESAKQSGLPVKANYVTVDIKEAIKRNYLRYLDTGRLPSVDTLISTHKGVSNNFKDVFDLFDSGNVIDTNGSSPEIIATFENGKLKIKNRDKFKSFINKKNESTEDLKAYFNASNIAKWEKEWLKKPENKGKKLRKRPKMQ